MECVYEGGDGVMDYSEVAISQEVHSKEARQRQQELHQRKRKEFKITTP